MHQIDISRLDLNLLVVFDAIARTQSVTRAADELALSQPAVSHALKRLRAAMGDDLFVRGRAGLTPTQRAKDAMRPVANLLLEARRVLGRPDFDPTRLARRFRLAGSDYAMMALAPAVARALRDAAPDSSLEVVAVGADTFDRLEAGDVDLAFWGSTPPGRPFAADDLFSEGFVGLIGAAHPLAAVVARGAVSLDDYLAYPHVVASFSGSTRSPVDKALAALGRSRHVGLATPSFAANVAALRGSDLIMTPPARLLDALGAADVVRFDLPFAAPRYAYRLVRHVGAESDPALGWLRALVRRAVSG